MPAYDTVTDALNDLKLRGFTTDFNVAFDKLQCKSTGTCLSPADFEITEHYRFEGISDPADECTVYAITSKQGSLKGILVAAYGAYVDSIDADLLRKLKVNE